MAVYHKIFVDMDDTNISLSLGDHAYKLGGGTNQIGGVNYSNASSSPVLIGQITKIEPGCLYVYGDSGVSILAGDMIMYSKNAAVNKSGIKGYYTEIKMEVATQGNQSIPYSELFAIGAEITPSSK